MIGERELKIMKDSAIIINTARGGIINEPALIHALEAGEIGGAGLDCFSSEPLPEDDPLSKIGGNVILTPHFAGTTYDALSRMGRDAVHYLLAVLDGEEIPPEVVINRVLPG
jgi:phosphoglycerate dehydrogenase-like enzyme